MLIVSKDFEGIRLDKFLTENTEYNRTFIQKLITDGNVTKDGIKLSKNYKVAEGDQIDFVVEEPKTYDVCPQNIPINIVYEDDDVIVINKEKGMVVHPAPGNYDSTLVNALMYHCGDKLSGINGVLRPGIVHRIDKDTSGLLVVAKNDSAHSFLSEQLKDHKIERVYETVVYKTIKEDIGRINAPIGRCTGDRKKMAVTEKNSKEAITDFEVIKRYGNFTHVKCELKTGRTHQIRVHFSYIGHPVAGDILYGPKKAITELGGQCLHAKKLKFIHPRTKEQMCFETDLPEYFKSFLERLNNNEL